MYLWGTERGQRDQLIFGGTQNLLGAAQEQSSARAQAARELCQEHPQRGVGTRRWWPAEARTWHGMADCQRPAAQYRISLMSSKC